MAVSLTSTLQLVTFDVQVMVCPPAWLHRSIAHCILQLIFSVFKTLTGQEVIVELKNDLSIQGKLKSVDQCVSSRVLPAL
jgi:hypothetical protein